MHPRLVVAALRGGSGKTILTMGLCAELRRRGVPVVPFKKGPDYIDAAWLGRAAGATCRHLDPYLMPRRRLLRSFLEATRERRIALIEGNRGLYDGVDPRGSFSTAELAKALGAPVVVVVDATKTTRTAAAMVVGLRTLDSDVDIRGVVLNQVAGSRHEAVLRKSIEGDGGTPVLGALPRMLDFPFPERHLGLVPPEEHLKEEEVLDRIAWLVREHVDVDGLLRLAEDVKPFPDAHIWEQGGSHQGVSMWGKVGVIRDRAFHFYYPENLEIMETLGLGIVSIDSLRAEHLPAVDVLYIGGGFPESFAPRLAENVTLRKEIRQAASQGLPIYAECGGLMYLGEGLRIREQTYPMVGVLPLTTEFRPHPQGHGYTTLEVMGENPFFPCGSTLKGHEFHYSRVVSLDESRLRFAFRVRRGRGIDGRRDGLVRWNVLATYTHLHVLGCPQWADGMVTRARRRNEGVDEGLVAGGGLI